MASRKPFGLQQLAGNIARAREAAGLTQADLARRLKVDRQQVYRWENAGREPGSLTLRAIAAECGVSADQLLALPNRSPE